MNRKNSIKSDRDHLLLRGVFAYGTLSFKQIASIAGLWGFVFIFSWFASIVNYGWKERDGINIYSSIIEEK
jgi:apolipoprotein N-acyltransferase